MLEGGGYIVKLRINGMWGEGEQSAGAGKIVEYLIKT